MYFIRILIISVALLATQNSFGRDIPLPRQKPGANQHNALLDTGKSCNHGSSVDRFQNTSGQEIKTAKAKDTHGVT